VRSTSFLLEHHVIPGIRDEIDELGLFIDSTDTFLRSLHDHDGNAMRGVSRAFPERCYGVQPEGI
jgi:hypothetical protein